ncbi:hypothetical protein AD006_01135 [Pseudonocardia sp. EC080610-09]|uniref:phage portal protein n=1 Tax=unclassified Pseudonocardia TaxID=2619320 RepID=UPI000705C6FD|nr:MULTISPECIES: phage portal protein [unclassified Pseudonocardia]ALL74271.1 hypothetical protein AD006_01135 [Pseudonocardia sp. EC080610-09]ALL81294.1 hypothetical protein AD017_08960 [Pseudonocardia sp. EC080619-01]
MLGRLLTRNLQYQVTNTQTGFSESFTILQPPDGLGPEYGPHSTLGIPAVHRSVTLLSDLVGSMPWHAYRTHGGRDAEKVDSRLLDQPNPLDTRTTTFASLVLDYLLNGNAIAGYTARDSEGWPTAMIPVPATSVMVQLRDNRRVYRIGDREYDQDDIFHVKDHALPGELRGFSRLEMFRGLWKLSKDQDRATSGASNSGVPTGVLKVSNPDATVEDLQATKTGWMNAQSTRSVAVLNATTDFVPVAWNPSEAQLLEARKLTIHEIGLVFGIPLSFLGVEAQSMTYENGEQKGIDLLKFTVGGILSRFEQEFTKAHPRGTTVKANADSLLRTDTLTRYQAHEIALRNKFLMPSEVRALEDLPAIPGQDDKFLNPPEPPVIDSDEENLND